MAGTFGGDHDDIDVSGWMDLIVVNIESVSKGQYLSGFQRREHLVFIDRRLGHVRNQHHDDVGIAGGFGTGLHPQTIRFSLFPG